MDGDGVALKGEVSMNGENRKSRERKRDVKLGRKDKEENKERDKRERQRK